MPTGRHSRLSPPGVKLTQPTKVNTDWRRLCADCFLHWRHYKTGVTRSCWLISRWSMIRCSFWDTGEVELHLYIMCSLVTSILGITLLIRLYFLIWWCGDSLFSRRIWVGWCRISVRRIIWNWQWIFPRKRSLLCRTWCLIHIIISGSCRNISRSMPISIFCLMI